MPQGPSWDHQRLLIQLFDGKNDQNLLSVFVIILFFFYCGLVKGYLNWIRLVDDLLRCMHGGWYQIAVLEEQNNEEEGGEQVEDEEAKPSETELDDAADPASKSDDAFDEKPDINDTPMEESQVTHLTLCYAFFHFYSWLWLLFWIFPIFWNIAFTTDLYRKPLWNWWEGQTLWLMRFVLNYVIAASLDQGWNLIEWYLTCGDDVHPKIQSCILLRVPYPFFRHPKLRV